MRDFCKEKFLGDLMNIREDGHIGLERLERATSYVTVSLNEMANLKKMIENKLLEIQEAIMSERWDPELVYKFALICQEMLYVNQIVLQNMIIAGLCTADAVAAEFKF